MILTTLITSVFFLLASTTGTSSSGSGSVMSNTTKANYINSQNAHHVMLGSSSKRWESKRTPIINIQLPSINADCSGIDIFNGAFSFIKAEELVKTFKNIGSATTGFAFYLALETVSPQIASGIKHLAKTIQDMNALNIGSCEGAAALLGAVAPRHSKLHENTCKLMSNNEGVLSDFVAGRKGCKEGAGQRIKPSDKTEDTLKDVLQEACNVAWYVISKNTVWDTQQLKETLMSVTGTIITEPGKPFSILEPLAMGEAFFDVFATGGKMNLYTCNNNEKNKCLTVTQQERVFSVGETHAEKVKKILDSIEDKIYTNTALDDQEKNMIEHSRIPILKIINIMSAYHKGKAPISIQTYVDIIAHDLLTQHVKHMVNIIREIASAVNGAQINAELLQQYMEQLRTVEKKLKERDEAVFRRVDQILQIIQKIQLLEQSTVANMRVLAP